MYLKDSNKKLNKFEDFKRLYDLQEKDSQNFNISFKFFKYFIITWLKNLSGGEVIDYHYSISEEEINKIANNLIKNDEIWNVVDESIANELEKYEVCNKNYKIGTKEISLDELKAMFNFVYSNKKATKEDLLNFLQDIYDDTIYVTICDNERDLIWSLFVEGEDTADLINNFEFVLEKAKEGYDYKKDEKVLEYNGRFFIIQF